MAASCRFCPSLRTSVAIRTRNSSVRPDLLALVIAHRTETPGQLGRIVRVARDALKCSDTARFELLGEVAHGIGKLREDQHFFVWDAGCVSRSTSAASLASLAGVPGAALCEHREQRSAHRASRSFFRLALKSDGTQPLEAPAVLPGILLHRPALRACETRPRYAKARRSCRSIESGFAAVSFSSAASGSRAFSSSSLTRWIEQFGILRADGQVQLVLNGMQIDKVAQHVPLDGLDEGRAAALQAFEEVGAAEAHQAFAGV